MEILALWDKSRRLYHIQGGCADCPKIAERVVSVRGIRWRDSVCGKCLAICPEQARRFLSRKRTA